MTVRDEHEAVRAAERLGAAARGNYALPVGNLVIDATMGIALDVGELLSAGRVGHLPHQ
jgi:hypothetical protein